MKIVLLGTAGYHPNESRHTTCVALPESGLFFDAGTSFFRLPKYLCTDTIDIFLSHAHLDHVVGLTFLLDILHQHPLDEVRVHGEDAKLAAVCRHLFSSELFPVDPPFVVQPLSTPAKLPDGGVVTHCDLRHPGGSVGYRVDWTGRSMAFITDTTAAVDAPYVEFIQGVDVLVHECNFPDGYEALASKTGHSCISPVIEVAARAKVGRLVLIHFNPLLEGHDPVGLSSQHGASPDVIIATDDLEIDF